jgi:riboflavin synthase
MFTGIIETMGSIAAMQRQGDDMQLQIRRGTLDLSNTHIGDSIAVNGVCLTVVSLTTDGFTADISHETLTRTTLGDLQTGDAVNLEKALLPTTPIGGHFVSGHVDGIGAVVLRETAGQSVHLVISVPKHLAKYIAEKGSVSVDGISLTVNAVNGAEFDLNIVPHTLQVTIINKYQSGRKVNIEVDIIARYLERLLLGDAAAESGGHKITPELLAQHGFVK